MGITKVKRDPDAPVIRFRDLVRDHGHLLIPIVVLTWRLLIGESPAKSPLCKFLMIILSLFHAMILGRRICRSDLPICQDPGGLQTVAGRAKLGVILGTMGSSSMLLLRARSD
jgi:TRAP-type uncharacterized transport system fused permease subunit